MSKNCVTSCVTVALRQGRKSESNQWGRFGAPTAVNVTVGLGCCRRVTWTALLALRAIANGVKFGRKPKLSDYQRQEAIKRRAAGESG